MFKKIIGKKNWKIFCFAKDNLAKINSEIPLKTLLT